MQLRKRAKKQKKVCKCPPVHIFTQDGLVPTESIPYQIVFMSQLKESYVDRLPIFCSIPCEDKEKYQEGEIISLRWNNVFKGKKGGYFPNGMIIDIWFHGNKYHTKLFSTGILQMCNLKSIDEAMKLTTAICSVLRTAMEYVSYLKTNHEVIIPALRWLRKNSAGELFEYINTFEFQKDKVYGTVRFCKRVEVPSIQWPLPSDMPEAYAGIIEDFKTANSDLNRKYIPHRALKQRVIKIVEFSREEDELPSEKAFTVRSIKYSGCVRRYNLGFHINRYALNKLLEELGYNPVFPNRTGAKVTLTLINKRSFNKKQLHRANKSGDETLIFNPRGTVTHNGSIETLMDDTYEKVMYKIWLNRHRIMASQEPASTTDKHHEAFATSSSSSEDFATSSSSSESEA